MGSRVRHDERKITDNRHWGRLPSRPRLMNEVCGMSSKRTQWILVSTVFLLILTQFLYIWPLPRFYQSEFVVRIWWSKASLDLILINMLPQYLDREQVSLGEETWKGQENCLNQNDLAEKDCAIQLKQCSLRLAWMIFKVIRSFDKGEY